MAKSRSSGGIIQSIFSMGLLLAVSLMIIGRFIDSATDANASWVTALNDTVTALGGSTTWFALLITASFGGMAYALVMRLFNR